MRYNPIFGDGGTVLVGYVKPHGEGTRDISHGGGSGGISSECWAAEGMGGIKDGTEIGDGGTLF